MYIKGKRPKKRRDHIGHNGRDFSHYHLREVANVKHLNAIQKKSINRKRKNRKRNRNGKNKARVGMNVVDARYKLLQKALEKPTVIDAREKINERHLQSILYDTARKRSKRDHYNNYNHVQFDHSGIFTARSTWYERNHKDTNIQILPDFPRHVYYKRNAKYTMFNQDDQLDNNSKNYRCLSKIFHSRLDSHPKSLPTRAQPIGYTIIISNLEASVTCEDIKELFEEIGDLLYSKVIQPGVAKAVYVHYADAIRAIDVYHNRQLDGRPMKCEMVMNADSNTDYNHRYRSVFG